MRALGPLVFAALVAIACGRSELDQDLLCQPPFVTCGDRCIDVASDSSNCGACGLACGSGSFCSQGQCVVTCANGLTECDADVAPHCARLTTDNHNCGACGHACLAGQVCSLGQCASSCAASLATCGSSGTEYCADTLHDEQNCGACGLACNGSQCDGGVCVACDWPNQLCPVGGKNECVDTSSDNSNCFFCGANCPAPSTCTKSVCRCPDLTEACSTGCPDWQTDLFNCGGCGVVCAAGAECVGGSCHCPVGASTICAGRCVDLDNDAANCASCGHACAQGESCVRDTCVNVIARKQHPLALTVDSVNVYWLNTDGTVMSCPTSGCTQPTLVTQGPATGWGRIVTDGSSLYWTTLGTVYACPVTGCSTPQVLADGQSNSLALTVAGANVYWANYGLGTINACSTSGCNDTPTVVATNQGQVLWLASDTTNLYWTNAWLVKCALGSCTPTTLYGGYDGMAAVATDGTYAYAWDNHYTYDTLERVDVSTSSASTLTAVNCMGAIKIDSTNVYFVGGTGWCTSIGLNRIPKTGGSVTTLAWSTAGIPDVALDSNNVYWLTGDGDVLSLTK